MYKRIIFSFVFFAVAASTLFSPQVVSAQSNWWAPTYEEFSNKVENDTTPANEIFGERYTHAQVWWVIYSLISFAIEHKVSDCATNNASSLDSFINCAISDASTSSMASAGSGLGFLEFARLSDSMIRMKPASGVSYTAHILNNIGISTAYAQESGFGFNALSPVLGLWTAARNAAYALTTLAIIILAFMVMFRMRISPQLTVGVMSAIPRVIIGLLLITFSYAIAGFIIDLSYVILGLLAAVVSQSSVSSKSPVEIFNMVNDIGGGILNFGLAVVWIVFKSGFTSVFTVYIGFVASVLVLIIALLLIIIAIMRIFWIFLRTYVMVILHVIALPFAALGYIASPSGNMFMLLLRSLVGNVSVFVSVAITVMMAHILLFGMSGGVGGILSGTTIGNVYGVQPLAGQALINLPGFYGVDATTLGLFVGIVVLLMGPSLANNIKSWIITGRSTGRFDMVGAGIAAAAGGLVGGAVGAGITGAGGKIISTRIAGSSLGRALAGLGVGQPATQQTGSTQAGANVTGAVRPPKQP